MSRHLCGCWTHVIRSRELLDFPEMLPLGHDRGPRVSRLNVVSAQPKIGPDPCEAMDMAYVPTGVLRVVAQKICKLFSHPQGAVPKFRTMPATTALVVIESNVVLGGWVVTSNGLAENHQFIFSQIFHSKIVWMWKSMCVYQSVFFSTIDVCFGGSKIPENKCRNFRRIFTAPHTWTLKQKTRNAW